MREIFQIAVLNLVDINTHTQMLSPPQQALIFLSLVITLDFATGLVASWMEFKKTGNKKTGQKKYVIESAKLRLTAVKFICYSMGILSAQCIQTIFFIKRIPAGHIATKDLTLTTVIIGYFCVIEIYSIFFENIKRMGFDIIEKTKVISNGICKLYNTIKNGYNNN